MEIVPWIGCFFVAAVVIELWNRNTMRWVARMQAEEAADAPLPDALAEEFRKLEAQVAQRDLGRRHSYLDGVTVISITEV